MKVGFLRSPEGVHDENAVKNKNASKTNLEVLTIATQMTIAS